MRVGIESRGYTIIEIMLFLAISGLMFIIAAGFVSGKQTKAQFRQGMNQITSQIRSVINDVGDGNYPSSDNFTCSAPGAAGGDLSIISVSAVQGSNKGCVFMGKVMQFRLGSLDDTWNKYDVYSVAGRQYYSTQDNNVSPNGFDQSRPQVIGILTSHRSTEWNLKAIRMNSGTTPVSGVGFYTSFGKYTSGSLNSGAQNVLVVPVLGGASDAGGATEALMPNFIKTETTDANTQTNPSISICFEGDAKQYGQIIIGGSGQRTSTTMRIIDKARAETCRA